VVDDVGGSVVDDVGGSVVVDDGGALDDGGTLEDGGTLDDGGGGQMSDDTWVVAVYDDTKPSSNVTVAVSDGFEPAASVVVADTVVAVWLDDETDRLKLTDWIVWSPAFDEEKVQCTVTVCPVHVAAPPPPFRSWADAEPATKATPSALIPTVNRPVASSGRIRTELTPLSWRGRFRARSAADYATSCVRRINTPALRRPVCRRRPAIASHSQ
jgi:hypothetical protein